MSTEITRLEGLRDGFRWVLGAGVAASVAANLAVAQKTAEGLAVAAIAPVALFVTIEMLSRFPVTRGWLSLARTVTTGVLGVIGAWVSYWHMVTLCERAGEGFISAHILPVAVDGMMLVATLSLIEIGAKLRAQVAKEAKEEFAKLPIRDKIARLIAENPMIKNVELARALSVTPATVGKYRPVRVARAAGNRVK